MLHHDKMLHVRDYRIQRDRKLTLGPFYFSVVNWPSVTDQCEDKPCYVH